MAPAQGEPAPALSGWGRGAGTCSTAPQLCPLQVSETQPHCAEWLPRAVCRPCAGQQVRQGPVDRAEGALKGCLPRGQSQPCQAASPKLPLWAWESPGRKTGAISGKTVDLSTSSWERGHGARDLRILRFHQYCIRRSSSRPTAAGLPPTEQRWCYQGDVGALGDSPSRWQSLAPSAVPLQHSP